MRNLGPLVLILTALGFLLVGVGLLPTTLLFWAVIAIFAAVLGTSFVWGRR